MCLRTRSRVIWLRSWAKSANPEFVVALLTDSIGVTSSLTVGALEPTLPLVAVTAFLFGEIPVVRPAAFPCVSTDVVSWTGVSSFFAVQVSCK